MKKIYINIGQFLTNTFRLDLQLHMLWSFFFSMLGVFWFPLIITGLIATIAKEAGDLWTKGHWSWDDFILGIIGNLLAIIFIGAI